MTTATSQGEAHEVAKENKKAIQARNLRTGVLFTAPALIVLAVFVFYPAIQTFITSLTNGRINSNARRPAKFIGSRTTSRCSRARTSGPTSRTPSSTRCCTPRSS